MFLGLAISSAKDAADYLKAKNFEALLFGEERAMREGQPKPPPPLAHYVIISHNPSGKEQPFILSVALLEYVSQWLDGIREDRMMIHPNTALRLHSVWFAVRDLDAQLRTMQKAGLEPGVARDAKFLGAQGREVKAGSGVMLLLRSADKGGALSKFLSNHDDGSIIGISIEVSDLNKARSWVEGHSGHKLEPYNGFYGPAIMVPPDLTHGVWLELFERRSAGRVS
jgi:hypothetical protein